MRIGLREFASGFHEECFKDTSRGELVPAVLREARLFGGARQRAKILAEAECTDALLERRAMAAAETLKERFELEGACNVLFQFDEFASGKFFPARADRSVVAEAAEEKFDFGEGKAHVAGKADEEDAMQGVGGIAALAAEALGCWEEATLS